MNGISAAVGSDAASAAPGGTSAPLCSSTRPGLPVACNLAITAFWSSSVIPVTARWAFSRCCGAVQGTSKALDAVDVEKLFRYGPAGKMIPAYTRDDIFR